MYVREWVLLGKDLVHHDHGREFFSKHFFQYPKTRFTYLQQLIVPSWHTSTSTCTSIFLRKFHMFITRKWKEMKRQFGKWKEQCRDKKNLKINLTPANKYPIKADEFNRSNMKRSINETMTQIPKSSKYMVMFFNVVNTKQFNLTNICLPLFYVLRFRCIPTTTLIKIQLKSVSIL